MKILIFLMIFLFSACQQNLSDIKSKKKVIGVEYNVSGKAKVSKD